MSGGDYLSSPQFAPVEEVGKLESQLPGESMDRAYHNHEFRFDESANERAQFLGYTDARHYQESLNAHIARHGIQNPIAIGPAYAKGRFEAGVINGQHRYFAARDLGMSHVPTEPHQTKPVPEVRGWDYEREG